MKKALIAGLAIGLCLASSAQAAPIWIQYSGHEYALTETWTTWSGAQAIAATYGATLATIEDAAENGWLSATFDGLAYGRGGSPDPWMSAAWIGLYLDSGSWYWDSTKSLAGYIPPGSFSTGDTGIHAYMHIAPHPWPESWNNDAQHDFFPGNFYGIMERDIPSPSVPEPTTVLLLGTSLIGFAAARRRNGR